MMFNCRTTKWVTSNITRVWRMVHLQTLNITNEHNRVPKWYNNWQLSSKTHTHTLWIYSVCVDWRVWMYVASSDAACFRTVGRFFYYYYYYYYYWLLRSLPHTIQHHRSIWLVFSSSSSSVFFVVESRRVRILCVCVCVCVCQYGVCTVQSVDRPMRLGRLCVHFHVYVWLCQCWWRVHSLHSHTQRWIHWVSLILLLPQNDARWWWWSRKRANVFVYSVLCILSLVFLSIRTQDRQVIT